MGALAPGVPASGFSGANGFADCAVEVLVVEPLAPEVAGLAEPPPNEADCGGFCGAPGVLAFAGPVASLFVPFGPLPGPEPGVDGMRPAMRGSLWNWKRMFV